MLDVGWTEIVLILVIGVLVVGPKELPQMMYGIGRIVRRIQYMRFALSNQFDSFMQEAEIREATAADVQEKSYVPPADTAQEADEDSDFYDEVYGREDEALEKEPYHANPKFRAAPITTLPPEEGRKPPLPRYELPGYHDIDEADEAEAELSFLKNLRGERE
ncbi:MAG: twin-arginine translocase TatA/TatE family subunit [Pseudobdellovibrionaceae bacterium]